LADPGNQDVTHSRTSLDTWRDRLVSKCGQSSPGACREVGSERQGYKSSPHHALASTAAAAVLTVGASAAPAAEYYQPLHVVDLGTLSGFC